MKKSTIISKKTKAARPKKSPAVAVPKARQDGKKKAIIGYASGSTK